ncbi:DDE-type integrase/transposase/recombinase [Laribacter hongkongensis]|uniref:Mu transposase C-terminal domain-containing protein n=1 Tax=Laribacter hongkongensis TaxID=168471 RepID=UPI001EFE0BDC|nr:Mu transposase C-terminal domain-containing protein [Laribacter hongkongensis]MCG9065768.1 DDE-type integrase/transposase/recombinase [Laribacter hongkongensis]
MAGFALRKHMDFEWSGAQYRIERLQPNGEILLERLEDGHLQIVSREALLQAFSSGEVRANPNPAPVKLPMPFSRPLDELPEAVRGEVVRRHAYIQALLDDGAQNFNTDYLAPIVASVATRINDPKPPSRATLWRWYRRYVTHRDNRALIPRIDQRGSHRLKQGARVLQLAEQAIEEAYRASPAATAPVIYTRLLAKIEADNRQLPPAHQLKVPSLRTVNRLLHRVEAYSQVVLREGKAIADKRFRLVMGGTQTQRILERVEIDHTPLDLFLIDERSGLPAGRPTLTVVIDHYSRMLLGYYLSFGNPSTAAVMGALRHAILPKQPVKTTVPALQIQHAWVCYGRPDLLVIDNGLEFHSGDLETVAFDLGIRLQYCPKHEPRFKGTVERYLKTINHFFTHQLPGTSLARLHLRGEYDPQQHAVLTLAEFNQVFQKWVLDVYAQTIHGSLGQTPWSKWQEGLQRYEPELPDSLHALQRRIGKVVECSLRPDGVRLHGIHYNCQALSPILMSYGHGVKVRVLYDPEDMGEVQLWAPDSAEPVCVPALDQSYARGLTELQNQLIRRALREKGRSAQDGAALQRAKHELIQAVDGLMHSRKQRERRRGAAIVGQSSSKPASTALQASSQEQPSTTASPKAERQNLTQAPTQNRPPTIYPAFELPSRPDGERR